MVQVDFRNLEFLDRFLHSLLEDPSPAQRNRSAAFDILAEEDELEEVVHGGHSWEAQAVALT